MQFPLRIFPNALRRVRFPFCAYFVLATVGRTECPMVKSESSGRRLRDFLMHCNLQFAFTIPIAARGLIYDSIISTRGLGESQRS